MNIATMEEIKELKNEMEILDLMIELHYLSEKCYIVNDSGVPMPIQNEELKAFRTKLYLAKDTLFKKKNLETAAIAMASVLSTFPNTVLHIAGLYSIIAGNKKAKKDMKKWNDIVQKSKEYYLMLQEEN